MIRYRPARSDDASELAALGRQTFVDTFVDGFAIPYPADDLAGFLQAAFSVPTTAASLADPARAWWVAEDQGTIVAFAEAGPCALPHPEAGPHDGELKRLYVGRAHQGLGLGPRLLEIALGWLNQAHAGPQWIGVWSGNRRAQALYARHGFTKAGEYDYPVGRWIDREFILRRA